MLADYHVHTDFSDDSSYEMKDAVADAVGLGLTEICFTDHVDYGVKQDWPLSPDVPYRDGKPLANVDYTLYVKTIRELQAAYGGQISIKMGLEFGMQTHTIEKYESLFRRYPFDFILLSVHEIDDKELWTQAFQRGRTQDEYNLRYYEELLALVKRCKSYSVLGHLDLISRYDLQGPYPFEKIKPAVSEILKTVIGDGKGIEVNTSGRRYGLNDLTPSTDILKLYRELGGTVLTIGSDSHEKKHLGAYIAETKRLLLDLGFDTYCTYSKMKPSYHLLKE